MLAACACPAAEPEHTGPSVAPPGATNTRTPQRDDPLRGSIVGRVSNVRVPREWIARARLQLFDRYPVGATAMDSLAVPIDLRPDGRFAIDAPPGRYYLGARLGPFATLLGPITVADTSEPRNVVLAPDFVAFDVVTRRTRHGPQMVWANVIAIHPSTRARIVRAYVTVEDAVHRWRLPLTRSVNGPIYHLDFSDTAAPIVRGERLTLTLRTPELDDVPVVRTLRLRMLSDGIRLIDSSDNSLEPLVIQRQVGGKAIRWYVPEDASYSMVCLLADAGTLLLDGCDEAVTSPYWLDTSRLTPGRPYELLITAGRAVANGDGTAFNIDTLRMPLVVN